MKNKTVGKALVGAGAMLGFLTLALPLFEQPVFYSPLARYGFGLPLFVLGLVGRIYSMIYLQARIEEKHILEVEFGTAYAMYRQRVGMLLPRFVRDRAT